MTGHDFPEAQPLGQRPQNYDLHTKTHHRYIYFDY